MSSTSPGPEKEKEGQEEDTGTVRQSRVKSSLTDRVGFFEQVFSSPQVFTSTRRRSRSRSGGEARGKSRLSRVSAGYHGPRTDARDRSSEDPRRHRIPRASLSPVSVPGQAQEEQHDSKLRSRSASRVTQMDRRASRERSYDRERRGSKERGSSQADYAGSKSLRDKLEEERFLRQAEAGRVHDDIPPYRTIQIKRTQSGRLLERGGTDLKPRALSFRVSPQAEDVHQPLQPIFHRSEAARDQSLSITQHIQSKVSASRPGQYEKPPPLPVRPPRQHQRHSEPRLPSQHQQVRESCWCSSVSSVSWPYRWLAETYLWELQSESFIIHISARTLQHQHSQETFHPLPAVAGGTPEAGAGTPPSCCWADREPAEQHCQDQHGGGGGHRGSQENLRARQEISSHQALH